MSGTKIIYFDACIYLAYLRNETLAYGEGQIRGIAKAWKASESGLVTVVTSSIVIAEVLAHKLDDFPRSEKKFWEAMRGVHQVEDVTPSIADRARKYRDHYNKFPIALPGANPPGSTMRSGLTTPDAIHLATAVLNHCDQMWTFDGRANCRKDKSIGLLWLGNKVGDDDLIISEPDDEPPPAPPPLTLFDYEPPKN